MSSSFLIQRFFFFFLWLNNIMWHRYTSMVFDSTSGSGSNIVSRLGYTRLCNAID